MAGSLCCEAADLQRNVENVDFGAGHRARRRVAADGNSVMAVEHRFEHGSAAAPARFRLSALPATATARDGAATVQGDQTLSCIMGGVIGGTVETTPALDNSYRTRDRRRAALR